MAPVGTAYAATTVHTNLICDIALLVLASQPARFVRADVEHRQLAVLPAAQPEKEAHYV